MWGNALFVYSTENVQRNKRMFSVYSTVFFGVSLTFTRMLIPALIWASYHPHVLTLRLLLLLVLVQIMMMLVLWQHRLNNSLSAGTFVWCPDSRGRDWSAGVRPGHFI